MFSCFHAGLPFVKTLHSGSVSVALSSAALMFDTASIISTTSGKSSMRVDVGLDTSHDTLVDICVVLGGGVVKVNYAPKFAV